MRAAVCCALMVLLTAYAGTNEIPVTTAESVNVTCGENVMLRCVIDVDVEAIRYYWTDRSKILCDQKSTTTGRVHCRYTEAHRELMLNIREVTPNDTNTYLCMVQTPEGHGINRTQLHVSDCTHPAESIESKQTYNQAHASGSWRIGVLVSLISILMLVSVLRT